MKLSNKIILSCTCLLLLLGLGIIGTYNSLNKLVQEVNGQWGQVENVYQRRADLLPNLVETVKGTAKFEKDTFIAVSEARAKIYQATTNNKLTPNEAINNLNKAQDNFNSVLSKVMLIVENYPELKSSYNFRDLQAQLEGTENRISVERMRFNEAVITFNTKRNSFPTILIATLLGQKFQERSYFQAQIDASTTPKVQF